MKGLIFRDLQRYKRDIYIIIVLGVLFNIPLTEMTAYLSGTDREIITSLIFFQWGIFFNIGVTFIIANSHISNVEKIYLNQYPVTRGDVILSKLISCIMFYIILCVSNFVGAYIINFIVPNYNVIMLGFNHILFLVGLVIMLPIFVYVFGLVFKFNKKGFYFVVFSYLISPIIVNFISRITGLNIKESGYNFIVNVLQRLFNEQILAITGLIIVILVGGFLVFIILKKIYESVDLEWL
ncbi:hypothetical protein SAMN02745163_00831 [Clostridium cavendishii DSM 21758]|uniref:ABC-2 family transporter protein n=1 Tax=Clostridium cavendishii DSM 21758 TaxID=1121302 RepID=A0A1M6EEA7_9CLOT|nr:hypothetical protein [Clostridium cavendishii]SHI83719.1 hypothetical protein SAMN02745163_00831 [Clostridium cavendishii DSM 21758]